MNKKVIVVILFIFLQLTVLPIEEIQSAEIVMTGDCFIAVPGGAGQGFNSVLFSPPGAVALSIYGGSVLRWKIVARVADPGSVPRGVQLWVRRTGAGMGPGEITGGSSYLQLESCEKMILRGVGDLSNIPLQFRLTGITPQTPEVSFNPEILFKVVDMP